MISLLTFKLVLEDTRLTSLRFERCFYITGGDCLSSKIIGSFYSLFEPLRPVIFLLVGLASVFDPSFNLIYLLTIGVLFAGFSIEMPVRRNDGSDILGV